MCVLIKRSVNYNGMFYNISCVCKVTVHDGLVRCVFSLLYLPGKVQIEGCDPLQRVPIGGNVGLDVLLVCGH